MVGVAEQLLTKKYYIDRLSMFMRESLGIIERIDNATELMIQLDNVYEKLFEFLDINSVAYDHYKNYNDENFDNKFLDLIGSILNCPRTLSIIYGNEYQISNDSFIISGTTHTIQRDDSGNAIEIDNTIPVSSKKTFELSNKLYYVGNESIIEYPEKSSQLELSTNKKDITLNNKEYLIYLRYQIAKSHFDGTREQLAELYGGENGAGKLGFQIIYIPNNLYPAQVDIYLNSESYSNFTVDFGYLFLNGLLTIESMGITYSKTIGNPTIPVKWDDGHKWDDEELWG